MVITQAFIGQAEVFLGRAAFGFGGGAASRGTDGLAVGVVATRGVVVVVTAAALSGSRCASVGIGTTVGATCGSGVGTGARAAVGTGIGSGAGIGTSIGATAGTATGLGKVAIGGDTTRGCGVGARTVVRPCVGIGAAAGAVGGVRATAGAIRGIGTAATGIAVAGAGIGTRAIRDRYGGRIGAGTPTGVVVVAAAFGQVEDLESTAGRGDWTDHRTDTEQQAWRNTATRHVATTFISHDIKDQGGAFALQRGDINVFEG